MCAHIVAGHYNAVVEPSNHSSDEEVYFGPPTLSDFRATQALNRILTPALPLHPPAAPPPISPEDAPAADVAPETQETPNPGSPCGSSSDSGQFCLILNLE
jgi:hypothetical protein